MDDFFNFGVQSLYAGSSSPYNGVFESSAVSPLEGVQSATFSLNFPNQDINLWNGNGDIENVLRPTAQLDFSYILASEANESKMGFAYNYTGSITPALSNINTERNYYLVANMNGQDMIGYSGTSNTRVIGLGNAVITKYGLDASVGRPTTVNVSVDGLNLLIQTGSSGQILPAVNKQNGLAVTGVYSLPVATIGNTDYFSASPSSIILSIPSGASVGVNMSGINECPLDSFSFNVDLPRMESKHLGWAYPEYRPVQWPATITMRAEGTINQLQADYLNKFSCSSSMSFSVGFKSSCYNNKNYSFSFNGARIESQQISASIGGLNRINLSWVMKVFDLNRTNPNFYINSVLSSQYNSIIFPQVDYTSGNSPLVFNLNTPSYLSVLRGPAIISGNSVQLLDMFGSEDVSVLRVTAADGSDTRDLTITAS
jgi:hypothetical protein